MLTDSTSESTCAFVILMATGRTPLVRSVGGFRPTGPGRIPPVVGVSPLPVESIGAAKTENACPPPATNMSAIKLASTAVSPARRRLEFFAFRRRIIVPYSVVHLIDAHRG